MQAVSSAWEEVQELRIVPMSFLELTLDMGSQGTKTFTKTHIMSYTHTLSSNLLSAAIPSNEISWTLDNTNREWDVTNPVNEARFLTKASRITVRYGQKTAEGVEWIPGGVFYLSEWSTPSNGLESSFRAVSSLSYLTDTYTGTRKGTLKSIGTAALTQMQLPNGESVTYSLDESLDTLQADFEADTTDYTCAEVVQLVANAARCVLFYDRSGKLHMEPLSKRMAAYSIPLDKCYSFPEFELSKQISAIQVSYADGHVSVEGLGQGNIQTVNNPLVLLQTQALAIGSWTATSLVNRKTVKVSYRADPRVDILDRILVESQSGQICMVVLTNIQYQYTGAWKGTAEGRILELESEAGYAGERYAMETGDIIPVLESEV